MNAAKLDEIMHKIFIRKGDITDFTGGAIVNAANSDLMRGHGVCGAIFGRAGNKLDDACKNYIREHGRVNAGEAAITPSYIKGISAIIHAVGPIYTGSESDAAELRNAYRNSLLLAINSPMVKEKTIAFPLISTGIYGYPKEEAVKIAFSSVIEYEDAMDAIDSVCFYAYSNADFAVCARVASELRDEYLLGECK